MTNILHKIWIDKWLRGLSIIGFLLLLISVLLPEWHREFGDTFIIRCITSLGFSRLTIWEIVSMVWSFCFAFYYFHHINKMGQKANTTVEGILAGSIILLPIISIFLILAHSTLGHLVIEYLMILVFWKIDKNFASKLNDDDDDKIDFKLITAVLNTPLLFCFTIVFLWYSIIYFFFKPTDINPYKNFISGFSATIFIIINVIFIIIQSGIIRELYKCRELKEKCKHCKIGSETRTH